MADRVGQQLGNYRLIRLLGQGGFAEVYLGEHIHLGSEAAIKLLHTQLAEEDIDAFRTEARTLARLIHPHIVRVFDFGMEGETPYLVMDYAPGSTVRKRHPRGVALPLSTILDYVMQVADALQYAHDERFIHRDIKPENLVVGRRQEILLSDFGIALLAQTSHSQSMQDVTGTASYMAPEQFQGKPRQASDQYSLAVMVYEWLTGACPFRGSFTEIASQHLFVPPPPLREQVPDLSPAVEQVVMTALAKDPHQRFATVQVFATAFAQASQVELTETIPASRSSRPTELATEPNESVITTERVTEARFAPTEYAPPSPPASALAPTEYAQPSSPALPSLPSSLVTQPAEQPAASKLLPTLSRSTGSRSATVFCWNCSSPNQATEQFCTSCFAKLSVPATRQTASTLHSPPSSSPSDQGLLPTIPAASTSAPTEPGASENLQHKKNEQRMDECFALIRAGRYQEALTASEQMLRLDPNNARASRYKGVALNNLKRYQEALVALDQAIGLNPKDADAYHEKGSVLDNLKRYKEALVHLDVAIRLNPTDAGSYGDKGITLSHLDRYKEALVALEQSIGLNPNIGLYHFVESYVLAMLGKKSEARQAYNRAKALGYNGKKPWGI